MPRSTRSGMSFVEVLVAIAIIAILIALLLPATRRVREASARMVCQNNLKQLMLGMHNYHDASGSVALPWADRPAAPSFPPGCIGPGTVPEERLSWTVEMLPYLEQNGFYQQFDRQKGYTDNISVAQTPVKVFRCPESPEATSNEVNSYIAMAGLGADAPARPAGAAGNGFMGYDRRTSFEMIKDGTSNTITLTETRTDLGPWARGGAATVRGFESADLSSHGEQRLFRSKPSGMTVAMADGSVRFITSRTDPNKLAAAITIADGDPTELD